MALAVGTLLENRYRIDKPLSQGGMGAVYVAEQERPIRRKVAIISDHNESTTRTGVGEAAKGTRPCGALVMVRRKVAIISDHNESTTRTGALSSFADTVRRL